MKYCILILDGASGLPVGALDGRTCLEVASTPNLNRMAREGRLGLAETVPEGMEPSSAAACTSILGFDPKANLIGRGAIEAAAMGIDLDDDEAAFRCNLVYVENGIMRDYSAGHITSDESQPVVDRLQAALGDDKTRFWPGLNYRHIVTLKDGVESLSASCTPPHDIPDEPIDGRLPRGRGSERLLDLMERAKPVLAHDPVNAARVERGHSPANMIWLFWGGTRPARVPGFTETYGLRAAITSGVDLLGGLAAIFGVAKLDITGVTDGPDNDYAAQAEGALAALDEHDLVIIHVEAPDEAGHTGDWAAKIQAIECIDAEIAARLLGLQEPVRILALPDHPTPVDMRTHSREPVPFLVFGPGIHSNGGESYSEAQAASTGLFVEEGWRLVGLLTE